jgi:hypothetical protein
MAAEGLPRELSTNQKGAIAEAKITAEAIGLGIEVYRPVAEGGRCDLIFEVGAKLLRVQCKSAPLVGDVVIVRPRRSRRTKQGLLSRPYTEDEIDLLAAYCPQLDACFALPVSLVANRRMVYLRLSATRNNQRQGINWADQHELGAIAQLGERLAGSQKVAGSSPASSTERMRLFGPAER